MPDDQNLGLIAFSEPSPSTYDMVLGPAGGITMRAMARAPARSKEYSLAFSRDVERRFLRCRASIRAVIRKRLEDIVAAAGKARGRSKMLARKEPPLRFYVYEGFRIVYQVDPGTHRVIVLDIAAVTS